MFPLFFADIPDERQRAFMERVYLDHRSLMYAVAFQVLLNAADAEDAVQTAFAALCKKISLLQGMDCCTLRSYVVISVRNAAINVLRARGRRAELLFGDEDYADSLFGGDADDAVLAFIRQDSLAAAVRQLPERDRALMEMKYILGLSDAEIARRFGIKKDSVRSLLTRFRKRLYNLLKEGESDAQI